MHWCKRPANGRSAELDWLCGLGMLDLVRSVAFSHAGSSYTRSSIGGLACRGGGMLRCSIILLSGRRPNPGKSMSRDRLGCVFASYLRIRSNIGE